MTITIKEAADILNVDCEYINKLLKNNELIYSLNEDKIAIDSQSLLQYKNKFIEQREKALDELAELGQLYDIGYSQVNVLRKE